MKSGAVFSFYFRLVFSYRQYSRCADLQMGYMKHVLLLIIRKLHLIKDIEDQT